ncbi:MAG: hypothetical protein CW346_05820 [Bacillaceae bacterium]|uniref:Uncharacterized protein n=1 Tax=Caldibacillus debilis TaxID=301148 RepID=A0A150LYM0_9BACI|nr:hypothetical protein B4135_2550 [Caldibacillus debilis]MBY6271712.1 hypothetical protein [Bacillaceae bacterium]
MPDRIRSGSGQALRGFPVEPVRSEKYRITSSIFSGVNFPLNRSVSKWDEPVSAAGQNVQKPA